MSCNLRDFCLNPVNYRNLWDECPHEVKEANEWTGCFNMVHRSRFERLSTAKDTGLSFDIIRPVDVSSICCMGIYQT